MTMMRAGGKEFNDPGQSQPLKPVYYVDIVDDIRSQGMEPMITVPLSGFTPANTPNQPNKGVFFVLVEV
jgi:hypothetical protein